MWSHSHKALTGQGYSDVQCVTIRLSHITITTEMRRILYLKVSIEHVFLGSLGSIFQQYEPE